MAKTAKQPIDDSVKCRLYASGIWKLQTVAHFGGDETGIADMCLLQDTDGEPFIPGASIAGAARSYLAQQCLTWNKYKKGIAEETPELKRLFGAADKDDTMSALIVADATCVTEKPAIFIRDGVRIDAESGTAVDKAKYDVEVVERGTEFKFELECIIRKADVHQETELRDLFLGLLHAFEQGEIRLGARTRRGYGRGKVTSWETRELQMKNKDHVLTWLRNDTLTCNNKDLTPHPLTSNQSYIHIAADFELRTSLLIRSVSVDPNAPVEEVPDMTHLLSNGEPVVPGTSFAGAFRHRAALIANILNWSKQTEDEDAVCEIFGPVHAQDGDNTQSDLWMSRILIDERLVKSADLVWQDRVAIDRFTGGSLQNALFNEKPIYPLPLKQIEDRHIRLTLTLEEPDNAEIGLLLLTLRDFWLGNAALGGEVSMGRGTLQGIKAQFEFKHSDASEVEIWKFSHNKDKCLMTLDKGDKAFLNCCVKDAKDYANNPTGSRRPEKKKRTSNA